MKDVKVLPCVVIFKDKKANLFTAPMLFENEECACRYFETMISKVGSQITDYDLYLIGHYYDKTGDFFPLNENSKYLIKSGDEFKSQVDAFEKYQKTIELYVNENKELKEKLITANNKIIDLGGVLDE